MKRKTFVLKTDLDEKTRSLSDDELGKVFRKILRYVKEETVPKLTDKLEVVFEFIKVDLDTDLKKYKETCERRKESAQKRWSSANGTTAYNCMQMQKEDYDSDYDNDNDNDNDNEYDSSKEEKKENKQKKKFIKPTFEEVKAYCLERQNKVDPQKFIDYYESIGWKVGRNSMKNWKASIRTWERNDSNFANKKVDKPQIETPDWTNKQIETKKITEEELNELDSILERISNND